MLENGIQELAKNHGIDRIGVADLSPVKSNLVEQGGELFEKYPRAVSLCCRLSDDVIESIAEHENRSLIMNYQAHIYTIVNQRLDQAALSITKFIMDDGHLAFPVPASQVLSYENYSGLVPHKSAAHLAGLGWIGKSALFVTKEYGPRVRLATVYTDAPLNEGQAHKNKCGKCHSCVDACPPNACTGENFQEDQPRDYIFDAAACNEYMRERRLNLLGKRVFGGNCGLCVLTCPFGKPKKDENN